MTRLASSSMTHPGNAASEIRQPPHPARARIRP